MKRTNDGRKAGAQMYQRRIREIMEIEGCDRKAAIQLYKQRTSGLNGRAASDTPQVSGVEIQTPDELLSLARQRRIAIEETIVANDKAMELLRQQRDQWQAVIDALEPKDDVPRIPAWTGERT